MNEAATKADLANPPPAPPVALGMLDGGGEGDDREAWAEQIARLVEQLLSPLDWLGGAGVFPCP